MPHGDMNAPPLRAMKYLTKPPVPDLGSYSSRIGWGSLKFLKQCTVLLFPLAGSHNLKIRPLR